MKVQIHVNSSQVHFTYWSCWGVAKSNLLYKLLHLSQADTGHVEMQVKVSSNCFVIGLVPNCMNFHNTKIHKLDPFLKWNCTSNNKT